MQHRERAEQIVAGLPLADRIRLVSGRDNWRTEEVPGAVPSAMLADGPHGVRKELDSGGQVGMPDSVPATCFPPAATLACTWDPDLLEEVGRALGREARAQDVDVLLGPGLNLKRHPRGGRSFEYFSEDPLLSGRMAAALVRGIQAEGVTACLKHFAANSQETGRMVVDAVIDERTLRELYLRGFEVALAESAPGAVMTAYNRVNGQHCSDHRVLVEEVLRGEWGFDGLVVSDWGGTNDRVAGLAVGMDLEMPGGPGAFDKEVAAAIDSGRLAEADLDRCAVRVVELGLRAQERGGPAGEVDPDAHHALARRAAAAGTVLLTNDGLLPLAAEGSLAVIGAFAVEPRYQGGGSSRVHPTRVDCLLDALPEAASGLDLRYAAGYDPATGQTTPALLAEAAVAARAADRVVLVLGLPDPFEVEGRDRDDCRLPESMDQLAQVVLAANPSTAVIVLNGGAVELPWADQPAALVEAHLGGQAGGSALADVLLGRAEPGGRLAQSVPVAADDLPASRNFPGHPRQVEHRECLAVGYRFHDSGTPARFPFGHGLGYTTFEHGSPEVTGTGTELTVSVDVTNTGDRAGSHVVQVYVHDVRSCVPRPAKELAAFARVHLEAGATNRVSVRLDRRSFAVWDVAAHAWLVEAGEFEILVGASSTDIRGRATVVVDSPDEVTPAAGPAGPVATDAEFAALLGHPVPKPRSARPFTRNSTIADLAASRPGRLLAAGLRAAVARRFRPDDPDAPPDVLEPTLSRLPLRSFVLMGGGQVPFRQLDRVLAILNGDMRGVLGRRD
jgi:beta-glucosidase